MGEVQVQRYVCKICNKSCVSGRSLGGHMRIHLAVISASKKSAKSKAKSEIKSDCEGDDDQDDSYQLKEISKYQSNSDFQENIKNFEINTDSDEEDADHNSNYELRENPKKSWRISDPKHGLSICKECGKEFPTVRALSGHMRSHSIKNKKNIHHCKKCGKGFNSTRAMFGHMRSHSKRLLSVPSDESADSLSDLENLRPVRKKRSTIRYKNTSNHSLSNLNESDNFAVSELGDVEEVAESLIMLSRGVRDWSKVDSVIESSDDDDDDDDDDVYFGAESYGKCKDKNKNVCEFVAKDEMKADFSVENEIVEVEKVNEFANSSCVQESGFDTYPSENEANLEKNGDKRKEHECPTCFKVFNSGQALGGHKRAHYTTGFTTERKNQEGVVEVKYDLFDLNIPVSVDEGGGRDLGLSLWWAEMGREHEKLVLTS